MDAFRCCFSCSAWSSMRKQAALNLKGPGMVLPESV